MQSFAEHSVYAQKKPVQEQLSPIPYAFINDGRPGPEQTQAHWRDRIDVRHVLPAIRVPTLVLHCSGDLDSHIKEGRYIATHIPGAKFVELPGQDHNDSRTIPSDRQNFTVSS